MSSSVQFPASDERALSLPERLGDGERWVRSVFGDPTAAFVSPQSVRRAVAAMMYARQCSGADEATSRRGNGRRRRTACEACSGMTVAFVAPSPSEGARTR